MKKIKNLVIGGIQSKIFNLILFTVILLTAANMAVSLYMTHTLSRLAGESGEKQQEAIGQISDVVMENVVTRSLERSNRTEAQTADSLFGEAKERVTFMAEYAGKLLADPESFSLLPYSGPDPGNDGIWTTSVIFADGADPSDPGTGAKIGLLSNLAEIMKTLCPSTGATNAYIALPEGVHIYVSSDSSSWFPDGELRSFDPRTRDWFRVAAETGKLIFTEGHDDAITGAYCVECSCPVYYPDGELAAVVGTDLFLDSIEKAMKDFSIDGEYQLLVNSVGRAVLSPQEAAFPMAEGDRGSDLRGSETALLSDVTKDAVSGGSTGVLLGDLRDGKYYVIATPIKTTGWALISAYSSDVAGQPTRLLQDKNSEIYGEAAGEYAEKTGKARTTAVVLLVAVMLITLGGAIFLGSRITKPINAMTSRVAALDENNPVFVMDDAYRTGDEIEELAESFAAISHKTVEYLETVTRVTAEKERVSTELNMATQIQEGMLPNIYPAFPDRSEFDIYATMTPAREVGGDFYDFFLIDDDHLCMVMADVSGKGVPAALFMMASKIILQNNAMMGKSPAQILTDTNAAICSNNKMEMFVTVWLGILEISTGKLTAANAGHEYPALKSGNGGFELYKDKHGFVIGGMGGVRYKEYELTLEQGGKLFLYTDGVPEATDDGNELFGTDRMLESLNKDAGASTVDTLKNVKDSVDGFVKDAEQFDDLTMLCLEYKGVNRNDH
ncbi:MAG: SpoIIE family protein phosphatase [Clostridia bacterium]|nr:SpoIIE family protein phosphatase [Clostridia bacterium]